MASIDPHEYNGVDLRNDAGELIDRRCDTCGLTQRQCELTYKPRASIEPHNFNPTINTHGYEVKPRASPYSTEVCGVCGFNKYMCGKIYKPMPKRPIPANTGACQHFTGLRQWGMFPEPWRICTTCNWPNSQHGLPSCRGALNIKGEHFGCDLQYPHTGLACSSGEAQAIWANNDQAMLATHESTT